MVISRLNFEISKLHLQKKQNVIGAIVSCGGRPGRTGQHLDQVHARPFLIMSKSPLHVSGMNQEAFEKLKIKDKRLSTVPEPYT